jgi:hypothetical protein
VRRRGRAASHTPAPPTKALAGDGPIAVPHTAAQDEQRPRGQTACGRFLHRQSVGALTGRARLPLMAPALAIAWRERRRRDAASVLLVPPGSSPNQAAPSARRIRSWIGQAPPPGVTPPPSPPCCPWETPPPAAPARRWALWAARCFRCCRFARRRSNSPGFCFSCADMRPPWSVGPTVRRMRTPRHLPLVRRRTAPLPHSPASTREGSAVPLIRLPEAVGKRFGGVEIYNADHAAGTSHRTPP